AAGCLFVVAPVDARDGQRFAVVTEGQGLQFGFQAQQSPALALAQVVVKVPGALAQVERTEVAIVQQLLSRVRIAFPEDGRTKQLSGKPIRTKLLPLPLRFCPFFAGSGSLLVGALLLLLDMGEGLVQPALRLLGCVLFFL